MLLKYITDISKQAKVLWKYQRKKEMGNYPGNPQKKNFHYLDQGNAQIVLN
jgi:hypothetical protein